jgi:hypothetical protein
LIQGIQPETLRVMRLVREHTMHTNVPVVKTRGINGADRVKQEFNESSPSSSEEQCPHFTTRMCKQALYLQTPQIFG